MSVFIVARASYSARVLCGLFLVLAVAPISGAAEPDTPTTTEPLIFPSQATTYVVAPLDAEGYVDFSAAIDARKGRQVSLSENACAGLFEAVGPSERNVENHNAIRRVLGLPDWHEGDLLLATSPWSDVPSAADNERYLKEEERASSGPWKESDCPLMATLLSRNAACLDKAIVAVARPKYFRPLVRTKPNDLIIAVLLPDAQSARSLARQLRARAMLHLGHGRTQQAHDDLLAIHRLGRHIGQGATLIEGLVGIAIDAIASASDNAWAVDPSVTADQLAAYRKELAVLPLPSNMAESVDQCERLMVLDFAQGVARGRSSLRDVFSGNEEFTQIDLSQLAGMLSVFSVDWNATLIILNQTFDEIVAAMKLPDRTARVAALTRFEQQLSSSKGEAYSAKGVFTNLLGGSATRGKSMGKALASLLVPAVFKVQEAEDRSLMRRRVLLAGLAIQEHRRRTGQIPTSLEELAAVIPAADLADIFSRQSLKYVAAESGFLIYSVGPNGRDEGGSNQSIDPKFDDCVFSDPPPP